MSESTFELLRWIGWTRRRLEDEWSLQHHLRHDEAFVLAYLARNPGVIQRSIAAACHAHPAELSVLLRRLEQRGLVARRRGHGDPRSKQVFVTAEGASQVEGIEKARTASEEVIMRALQPNERALLRGLLELISAGLRQPV